MDKLENIIRLLKPKYYNRITYLLVGAGISLLSKPLLLDFFNWAVQAINENFKGIKFSIIGGYDWLLGLIIIIIALFWNTRNRIIDLKFESISQPEYKNVNTLKFENWEEVSKAIYPILKDNEYIFKTVGPNSGSIIQEELRTDLTMWYKYRSETILPNNQKIKEILSANSDKLDRQKQDLSNRMILHIDAFEEHTKNDSFDYTEYQFPQEFKEMIEEETFEFAKNSTILNKRKKWLTKKLKKIKIEEYYFFGSSLFIPEKARDTDIVILTNQKLSKNDQTKLKNIKTDFKLKFSNNLHVTVFFADEKDEYESFLEFNKFKIEGNG